MGSLKEGKIVNKEETKIPVFTVLKNGAILKNMFVINRPTLPFLESASPVAVDENPDLQTEEILIVGRHPDCNIVLMHPSISRFHLQINVNPSSHKLYVTDLTSVHGTWVSGKKIEPGIAIELNEGDTLSVGGSTRLYRLHWIPLSCAYEKDNPFVSREDVAIVKEKEGENEEERGKEMAQDNIFVTQMELLGETSPLVMLAKEDEEKAFQVINGGAEKNGEEIQISDSFLAGILPLVFNENCGFVQSEGIISESIYFSPSDTKEEIKCQNKNDSGVMEESVVLGEDDHFNEQSKIPEYHTPEEARCKKEKNTCMESKQKYKGLMNLDSSLFTVEVEEEENDPRHSFAGYELPYQVNKDDPLVPLGQEGSLEKCATDKILEETENQSFQTKEFASACAPTLPTESVNSFLPFEDRRGEARGAATENDSIKQLKSSCVVLSEKRSSSLNIWSRRGKPATALRLQTRERNMNIQGTIEVEWENQEDAKNLSFGTKVMEEVFTPDKEKCTPNAFLLKSMRKNGILEERRTASSAFRVTFSPSSHAGEDMFALSDKENQTPEFLKQRKSLKQTSRKLLKEPGRIPLQNLFVNSPANRISEISILNSASKTGNSVNDIEIGQNKHEDPVSINPVHGGKRNWTLVADVTSLLDKESRKSLKLLQGLKGTYLIVPRMVIRELDCYKQRRGTLFRRKSEASLALDWIDACLLETKWWIHVQSSEEEQRPTAPTPPQSAFSDDGRISVPFSVRGSVLEIISPTAEDLILDCALSCRKKNNGGQIVLLSNDFTLKIKAITEGFICETAQEFRDSLVNPFSDRFLWADSSPRGQTWSVLDDIVLKEWYYQSPSIKKSKVEEGSKGLKLILLHNSHHRLMNESRFGGGVFNC